MSSRARRFQASQAIHRYFTINLAGGFGVRPTPARLPAHHSAWRRSELLGCVVTDGRYGSGSCLHHRQGLATLCGTTRCCDSRPAGTAKRPGKSQLGRSHVKSAPLSGAVLHSTRVRAHLVQTPQQPTRSDSSMPESMPNPTREMLPAMMLAPAATKSSAVFQVMVNHSRRRPLR